MDLLLALRLETLCLHGGRFSFEFKHPHDIAARFAHLKDLEIDVWSERIRTGRPCRYWKIHESLVDIAYTFSTEELKLLGGKLQHRRQGHWPQVDLNYFEYRHRVSGPLPLTPEINALLREVPAWLHRNQDPIPFGPYDKEIRKELRGLKTWIPPQMPNAMDIFAPLLSQLEPWITTDWSIRMDGYFAKLYTPAFPQGARLLLLAKALRQADVEWERLTHFPPNEVSTTYWYWVPSELEAIGRQLMQLTYEHPGFDPWMYANAILTMSDQASTIPAGWICIGTVTSAMPFRIATNASYSNVQQFEQLVNAWAAVV